MIGKYTPTQPWKMWSKGSHNIYTPTYRIAGKTGAAQVKSSLLQSKRYNEARLTRATGIMAGLLVLPGQKTCKLPLPSS